MSNLTIIVQPDQIIHIANNFWKLPISIPIAINLVILLIAGFVCLITQTCCKRKIELGMPKSRETISDVTLVDFYNIVGKSAKPFPSTYFGKMVIVIAIFFSIPVFELTSYNLTVSNKIITSFDSGKLV